MTAGLITLSEGQLHNAPKPADTSIYAEKLKVQSAHGNIFYFWILRMDTPAPRNFIKPFDHDLFIQPYQENMIITRFAIALIYKNCITITN